MKRIKVLLIGAVVAATCLSVGGAFADDASCSGSGVKHSAAGSCKNTTDYDTHCGTTGKLPVTAGSIGFFANQTANGGEVEVCNDDGPGVTNGRVILKVDTEKGYARFSLDSDKDQKPNVSAGYINVQAGPGADQTGVWCSPASGPGSDGDGYGRSVNNPGQEGGTTPDKWVECIPTQ